MEVGTILVKLKAVFDKGGFDDLAASATKLGLGLSAALTGPLLGLGAAVLKTGEAFDDAFDTIAVKTGATGDALEALEQSFRNVVKDVPGSFADAAEAIGTLAARTNLTGEALEKLTKVELELARLTKGELAGQIAATTRLFGDWNVATDQQTTTLDKLFRAFQAGGGSVQSLAEKLVQFGAPLRQMGFDLDSSIALLAKFEKEGVNMELVLGSLRIALTRMAKEGIQNPVEALQIFIQRIQEAGTAGKANAIAMEVFGARAGPDMAAAIREGRFAIEDMLNKIRDGKSTILGTAESTKDFAERFDELRKQVMLALEPLGDRFFKAVNDLVPIVQRLAEKLTTLVEWFVKLPKPVQDFAFALGGIAIVAGPAITAISQVSGGIGSLIHMATGAIPLLGRFSGLLGGLGGVAGLMGAGVTGAFIAAEMGIRDNARKMNAHVESIGKQFNVMGKELMRIDSPELKAAMGAPGKLVNGMTVDLKTGLVTAAAVAKTGGAGIPNGFADGLKEGAGKAKGAVKDAFKDFTKDMADAVENLNKALGTEKNIHDYLMNLGKIPPPAVEAVNALDDLTAANKTLEGVTESANKVIGNTEPYVRAAGAAQVLQSQFDKLSASLPRAWNTILDAFNRGVSTTAVKVKDFAVGLLGVFDNLPGRWGQALNRTIGEVERWINFIDSAIKFIQKIMGSAETGLAGIFDKLAGSVSQAGDKVKEASHKGADAIDSMGKMVGQAGAKVKAGAGEVLTGLGSIAAGVMAFVGVRGQGVGAGVIGGALGGVAVLGGVASLLHTGLAPLLFSPWGALAVGVGALIGGIFGRKSQAQKDAEKRAAEQAKINMQQSAQAVVSAAIEGFDKALSFFEHLDDFTEPRKRLFRQFFTALTRLMNWFVDLAKVWGKDSLAQAKELAEAIKPVTEAVGSALGAFEGLNRFIPATESIIKAFAANLQVLIEQLGAVFESIPKSLIKHARKLGTNLESIAGVMGPLLEGLVKLVDFKPITQEVMATFVASLKELVERMGQLAEEMDQGMVKAAARFSERAGTVVSVLSEGVEGLKGLADLASVPSAAFDAFFTGLREAVTRMQDIAATISTDFLGQAEVIAQKAVTIFGAIKSGVESLSALSEFKGVLAETFTQFYDDFNAALDMLQDMASRAMTFDVTARTFDQYISSGAATLSHAFTMLAQIMNAAGAFFPGGSPMSISASVSQGTPMAPMSMGMAASSPPVVQQTVYIQAGSIVRESELGDLVLTGLMQANKRGKVASSVFTGTPALVR